MTPSKRAAALLPIQLSTHMLACLRSYVDKLVVIIRFLTKVGALQPATLDLIWGAAEGKHETIVANIHKLLSEIAPELDPCASQATASTSSLPPSF